MKISEMTIEQQVSWLRSHTAGVLKSRSMDKDRSDFWQVVLNVTNEVAALRLKLKDQTPFQ